MCAGGGEGRTTGEEWAVQGSIVTTICVSPGSLDHPVSFYKALRQCMAEDLLDGSATRRIGGPGHIIEIDESKFGKRKYNRGRRVVGKWVLGGYCRTTGECFLVECDYNNKRNHHSTAHLAAAHVEPATIILTDKWKGYNALSSHGFTNLVVKHRRGFVDPLTGVHTNTCEVLVITCFIRALSVPYVSVR